jgi:hypothetical protein
MGLYNLLSLFQGWKVELKNQYKKIKIFHLQKNKIKFSNHSNINYFKKQNLPNGKKGGFKILKLQTSNLILL